jgi:hypothetical protein
VKTPTTAVVFREDQPGHKTSFCNFGFNASVSNNEYDLLGVRDNKWVIGGRERSSGEDVTRTGDSFGMSVAPFGIGYSDVTETRSIGGLVTGTSRTVSNVKNHFENSTTTDNNGKKTNGKSLELVGLKLSVGVGIELGLKINENPYAGVNFPAPLPKYGNAPDNTANRVFVPERIRK